MGTETTGRTWLVRGAMVGVVAVAVGAAVVVATRDAGDSGSAAAPGEVSAELEARQYPTLVSVGDQVLVYGGTPLAEGDRAQPALNDAALMNVESETFEVLPEPPFRAGLTAPAAGVYTGEEVVLIGQLCEAPIPDDPTGLCEPGTYAAASLSVERRTWREVPIPDELQGVVNGDRQAVGATSDGRAVFVLGAVPQTRGERSDRHIWTYEPRSGEWAQVPDPDISLFNVCLAGDTIVAASSPFKDEDPYGAPQPNDPTGTQPYLSLLNLTEPSSEWRRTEQAPVGPHVLTEPEVTCSDSHVLVDDGGGHNAAFLAIEDADASRWQPVEEADGTYLDVEWTGEEFVFLDSRSTVRGEQISRAIDPATGSIRELQVSHVSVSDYVLSRGRLVGWRTSSSTGPLSTPSVVTIRPS